MIDTALLQPNETVRGTSGTYQIQRLIGRGGMGAVYRVVRVEDGTVWAMKEMRPPPTLPPEEVEENLRLFAQEAEMMRLLDHPNVVEVADFFHQNGRPTMIMELVPGDTLEDALRKANAPMLEQQVVGYGIQICRVLQFLHSRRPPVVFRDMKPSNVMATPEGTIKLIDFGVARTYKASKSKDTVAMGSAGYAPPEQYGKGQTDARSDLYALGATLLHLLTNLPPVPLQTPPLGSIRAINPSVDARTEKVIIRAMQIERDRRYGSAAEMEQALLKCYNGKFPELAMRPTRQVVVVPAIQQAAPQMAPPVPSAPIAVAPPVSPNIWPQMAVPATPAQAPAMPSAKVGTTCPICGNANKAGARFCGQCGTALVVLKSASLLATSPRGTWQVRLGATPSRIGRRDPSQQHYPEIDLADHDRGIASRSHAVVQRAGADYMVTDLASTNGTFLNGQRLLPNVPQKLRQGDRIQVGDVEMEFRWDTL